MTTKLTLSIDEETIKKAKQVSRTKGKSLSKLVEEYLKVMSSKNVNKKTSVMKLSGILSSQIPANIKIKETKGAYLKHKHGL